MSRSAGQEVQDLLATCPNVGSGCFADDPDSLNVMLFMDDGGIRADLNRVAIASDEAADADVPLEQATYSEVTFEPTGENVGPFSNVGIVRIGKGEQKTVGELEDGSWGMRVAMCAYQCAKNAQSCPLKTPQ